MDDDTYLRKDRFDYSDNFWTSVMGRPTARLQHRPDRLQRGHAKVGYLDVVLLVQEQVFWLQIPMTKSIHVTRIVLFSTFHPAAFDWLVFQLPHTAEWLDRQ